MRAKEDSQDAAFTNASLENRKALLSCWRLRVIGDDSETSRKPFILRKRYFNC